MAAVLDMEQRMVRKSKKKQSSVDDRVQMNVRVGPDFRARVKEDAERMGRDLGAQLQAGYSFRDRTPVPDLDRLVGRIGGMLAALPLSDDQRNPFDAAFADLHRIVRRIVR